MCVKSVFRVLQQSLKDISRKCQGRLKGVSIEFYVGFKGV